MKKFAIVSIGILAVGSLGVGVASALTPRTRQSPINIVTAKAVKRTAPQVDVQFSDSATLDIQNTWDPAGPIAREWGTLKANVSPGSTATLNGANYDLLQFHFHTPSEHMVNGKHAPMEVHFVFLKQGSKPCDRPDALLVIGTEIVAGKANPELSRIFENALPADKNATHLAVSGFDLTKIFGSVGKSWRYEGSLTAPASFKGTCDEPEGTPDQQLISGDFPENVQWVVRSNKITMSQSEIDAFRALFPEGNSREVQPLNGRTVTATK